MGGDEAGAHHAESDLSSLCPCRCCASSARKPIPVLRQSCWRRGAAHWLFAVVQVSIHIADEGIDQRIAPSRVLLFGVPLLAMLGAMLFLLVAGYFVVRHVVVKLIMQRIR